MTDKPNSKPTIDVGAIGAVAVPHRTSGSGGGGRQQKKASEGFTFYKLVSIPNESEVKQDKPSFKITKFDQDLNVSSGPYTMNYLPSNNGGYYDCNCPASKFDCRHKSIMKDIVEAKKQDSDYFFCFETRAFKLATEIA